jgi:hypothetical protein
MVLAVAVILFQMQALRPKADSTVAPRQELVRYAENIPAPGLFGAFAPIVPPSGTTSAPFAEDGQFLSLPDDDGTNTTPKAFPDANTQILSGVYIPDHLAPLPPLPDKHREAVRSGAPKRLYMAIAQSSKTTADRARRRLKHRQSVKALRVGSSDGDSLRTHAQVLITSE